MNRRNLFAQNKETMMMYRFVQKFLYILRVFHIIDSHYIHHTTKPLLGLFHLIIQMIQLYSLDYSQKLLFLLRISLLILACYRQVW
jgi:hypothetical protein